MATKLTTPIEREIEVDSGALRGDWTVTATAHGVLVRKKRSREQWGPVPWSAIISQAAKLEAQTARPTRRKRVGRNLLKL